MTRIAVSRRYTPQEAAALAGVRLQRIQNAITAGRLGRRFAVASTGRRRIDLAAVLTFATAHRLGKVRIEPATLYRAFRKAGLPHGPVPVTDSVTIDAARLIGPVVRNVELYETARKRIVSDPAIMGGVPIVKGTRIPARTLHARIEGGDSIGSVLEDYPYLDRDTVEAAVLFVAANPARGRPCRGTPADRA
ncbi:MAG TPA: DUF433 domain-containing protein [Stellaceae bacterium]|nr:DUF433 domain-containing protein [Stellaceae bacterium]